MSAPFGALKPGHRAGEEKMRLRCAYPSLDTTTSDLPLSGDHGTSARYLNLLVPWDQATAFC